MSDDVSEPKFQAAQEASNLQEAIRQISDLITTQRLESVARVCGRRNESGQLVVNVELQSIHTVKPELPCEALGFPVLLSFGYADMRLARANKATRQHAVA